MRIRRAFISVLSAIGLLAASTSPGQVERDERPDLIVSDLRHEGNLLVLEIQNQGAGAARGMITATVRSQYMAQQRIDSRKDIQIEAPQAPRAVVAQRIPLEDFAVPLGGEFSMMFQIALDTTNAVEESREGNNTFLRQLDYNRNWKKVLPNRAPYTGEGPLPDLVVTDIVHDGPYLKVKYRNASSGATGADFLIKIEANGKKYDGNYYYRYLVPPGNTDQTTGGFTLGLVGITAGSEVDVVATIDPEDRVRESDEGNNQFSKRVKASR